MADIRQPVLPAPWWRRAVHRHHADGGVVPGRGDAHLIRGRRRALKQAFRQHRAAVRHPGRAMCTDRCRVIDVPTAFTATMAPTVTPSGSTMAAEPMPLAGAARFAPACPSCSRSRPHRAPAAVPWQPRRAAALPMAASGAAFGSPTVRSNSTAAGTMGTRAIPMSMPRPARARKRITPSAAASQRRCRRSAPPHGPSLLPGCRAAARPFPAPGAPPRHRHAGHGPFRGPSTTVTPVFACLRASGPRDAVDLGDIARIQPALAALLLSVFKGARQPLDQILLHFLPVGFVEQLMPCPLIQPDRHTESPACLNWPATVLTPSPFIPTGSASPEINSTGSPSGIAFRRSSRVRS